MKNSSDKEPKQLPEMIIMELTKRCNNLCQYCYTAWGAPELNYDQGRQNEMTTMELKEIITKLHSEIPLKSIGISGGEPLLREDLCEIVSFIKDKGIVPIIISNGTLLAVSNLGEEVSGVTFEITLLSYRKEIHDQLVGRRGAWDKVIDGMAEIRQLGGVPVTAFIATKLNYMDLFKTGELAIALGSEALMYNRMNLGAHNMRFVDQLLPTPTMIEENLGMLGEMQTKYNLPTAISVVIEPCVVDISKYKDIRFGWCPLAGERSYFTIDPVGNIRICNHSPTVLGNIKRDSFLDIYYNHPYVRSFRETLPMECIDCEPELKQMCQGGCKAAGEQCYGTISQVDPFVKLNKEKPKMN